MNWAMAYNSADRPRAIEWLNQVKKWGGMPNHKLFLMPSFDCVPIPEIIPFVGLTDYLQIQSNWRTADGVRHADASGPNSAFRQFASYFYENKLGAWTWIEPDCVPLHPYSFDKWEEEYLKCNKPYFGGYVQYPVPHINGNAIYAQNCALLQSLMLPMRSDDGTRDIAFDVAAAREILPQAHATELIQHLWRGPSFTSQEDFDTRIRPDALFYHQCRDGSIYKYIEGRDKRKENGTSKTESPSVPTLSPFAVLSGHTNGSTPNNSIEVQRARAAKARAALAAKRATGWRPERKKRAKSKARNPLVRN